MKSKNCTTAYSYAQINTTFMNFKLISKINHLTFIKIWIMFLIIAMIVLVI